LFEENYEMPPNQTSYIGHNCEAEKKRFPLSETAGLIEYGYDAPVFDGNDQAEIVVCENDTGLETWFFGVEYDDEVTIIELDDFFVDIDYIINKVEEYNSVNEVDVVLFIDSFALGTLYSYGMLDSDLSNISPNLLIMCIGSIQKENESMPYLVGVVKFLDNTYKILSVEHSRIEYDVIIDLSEGN